MADLLIGYGEVGIALHQVLGERGEFAIADPPKGYNPEPFKADWMHVSIPHTDAFIAAITDYARTFDPKYIVIHSTVPVGTTRKVERECDYRTVYYSPVRGRHPNLARYIRDFPKWYACSVPGEYDNEFVYYFARAGVQTRKAPNFEFLEWAKLWETTSFGYNLVMWQEIEREASKLPGDKRANLSALKSWFYEKKKVYDGDLGYVPIYDLVPGPIGGHCIAPNWDLLKPLMAPELYAWLTSSNESRKE